jgi:CheY-like chemotaxis protein
METRSPLSTIRDLETRRVLIVEDNADSAELLGYMLEHAGYQAHVVHSAAAALETAQVLQPHVALIDIGLPGINGYELAARLRAQPLLGSCRLIATTGHSGREAIERSLAAGFDDHLTKPLDRDALLAVVGGFRRHARAAP